MKDRKRSKVLSPFVTTAGGGGGGVLCLEPGTLKQQSAWKIVGDKKMEFLDMHADALVHIASFLDHRDVVNLSSTCSLLLNLVDTSDVWMNLCRKWSCYVSLQDWVSKVNSPKALFRLLNSFDSVIGAWSAQELAPRGGLLYVTWGNLSVVAFRIMPEWMAQGLVCMKLFEVVGESDGSSRVALLTGRGGQQEVPLPGAIVWESDGHSEFHLETHTGPESAHVPATEAQEQAETRATTLEEVAAAVEVQEHQRQRRLREQLYQQQLMRTMWLAEDAPHVALPAPEPAVPAVAANGVNGMRLENENVLGMRVGGRNGLLNAVENGGANRAQNVLGNYGNGLANEIRNGVGNGIGNGMGMGNGNGNEHAHGNQELRHRAVQYLLRLATGGPNRRASSEESSQDPIGGCSFGITGEGEDKPRKLMKRVAVPKSKYLKLRVDVPCKGKELAGLWSGVYGPHGLEILNIHYTDEGKIVATKVLGDPNVPCGKVTFTASLESENSEPPPDQQQLAAMSAGHAEDGQWEIPSFVTTYQGEGRVAGYNYRRPSWVSGQLLVEKSGRFSFLWKEVNFIIRFRRLSLSDLVQLQQNGTGQENRREG